MPDLGKALQMDRTRTSPRRRRPTTPPLAPATPPSTPPPLIPPRGEVNAADAFDIGSFDEEDTKGIKLTEGDQELYKNFPLVISERWQNEVSETVFDTINHEYDKTEQKRAKQKKAKFGNDEKDSDCILHGYIKKLGGPFESTWQTKYAKLYPNRLELHTENNKPQLVFMEDIEDINTELVTVRNEQCVILRTKEGKIVLTNSDEIGLKEWSVSLRTTLRCSHELLSGLAKKAGKIYGTDGNCNNSAN